MRTLYVDSGYFIALIRKRDQAHGRTARHYRRQSKADARLVTSDVAVAETATCLRYDAGAVDVRSLATILERAVSARRLRVRESEAELRARALDLIASYADRPLSYANAVGALVAREARIDTILGFDDDFRILGFALEP